MHVACGLAWTVIYVVSLRASADPIRIVCVCVCVCVITSVSVILGVILRATGKITEQMRKEGVWRDWHMSLVNVRGFL